MVRKSSLSRRYKNSLLFVTIQIGQLSEINHHVRHISISTDGLQLFGASDDSSVKVFIYIYFLLLFLLFIII